MTPPACTSCGCNPCDCAEPCTPNLDNLNEQTPVLAIGGDPQECCEQDESDLCGNCESTVETTMTVPGDQEVRTFNVVDNTLYVEGLWITLSDVSGNRFVGIVTDQNVNGTTVEVTRNDALGIFSSAAGATMDNAGSGLTVCSNVGYLYNLLEGDGVTITYDPVAKTVTIQADATWIANAILPDLGTTFLRKDAANSPVTGPLEVDNTLQVNQNLDVLLNLVLRGAVRDSNISSSQSPGREILQLRAVTLLSEGAGLNLYGDGDSSTPGAARLNSESSTNPTEIWCFANGDPTYPGQLHFVSGGGRVMVIRNNQRVGFGTDVPGYKVHVAGDFFAEDAEIENALEVNTGKTINGDLIAHGQSVDDVLKVDSTNNITQVKALEIVASGGTLKHHGMLAAAPGSPNEGDRYYDTVTHKERVYDGTTWQDCW